MSKLFGVPVASLALVLGAFLVIALAVIGGSAARHRIVLRLGLRNMSRRRGRAALIVAGLMLGTAIITAALATGDTMSQTIRSVAISALGPTDEVVAAKGIGAQFATESSGTGTRYFPQSYAVRVAKAAEGSGLVAGVEPAIVEPVAVQDLTSRQTESRVTLFASDPARMGGLRRDPLGRQRPSRSATCAPVRSTSTRRGPRSSTRRQATGSASSPARPARPFASAPSCATQGQPRPIPG